MIAAMTLQEHKMKEYKDTSWGNIHRPQSINEYVFKNNNEKQLVESWIAAKRSPSILCYGPPGTGKSTLAKLLFKECGVQDFDLLTVNASHDNGIKFVRDVITESATRLPAGDYRVVLLNEASGMSQPAQEALLDTVEKYEKYCSFVLTGNHKNKIIAPMQSRLIQFNMNSPDKNKCSQRLAEVLMKENIDFDLLTVDAYVDATYPDLRACLNAAQKNSITGTLAPIEPGTNMDWKNNVIKLCKEGKKKEAASSIYKVFDTGSIESVYVWMYSSLHLWGNSSIAQDKALVTIVKGLRDHDDAFNQEMNLASTLTQLSLINDR